MFVKKNVERAVLICLIFGMVANVRADTAGVATSSAAQKQKMVFAVQIIEPVIKLNKEMVKSVKLKAFDNAYGRIDLILTEEASKQLQLHMRDKFKRSKIMKSQEIIFTINNKISD